MLLFSQLKIVRISEIVFLFQKCIVVIAITHVLVSTSKPCVSRVKCFVSCPISIVCGILQSCFIPRVPLTLIKHRLLVALNW